MKLIFHILTTLLIATPAFAAKSITIGTTAGDFADLAKEGLKPQLEKQGYQVRVIEFTDYVTPNIALAEGRIDANIFQHKPYLETFAKEKGLALKPLAQVPTAPLGLYAGKRKALSEIQNGSTIAIPNDPTNQARALRILAEQGWIELAPNANLLLVGTKDIVKNPKNLKVLPLEAAQIPRATQDVDFAVINGNYATNAGIKLDSALSREKSDDFINWAVVAEKNLNAEFAKDLQTALNSSEFKTYADRRFKGYKLPSTWK